MEAVGYLFAAVYLPLIPGAISLLWLLASRSQRRRPGGGLLALAALAVVSTLLAVATLLWLTGVETFDLFVTLPALLSLVLPAPVLVQALRRDGVNGS